jgi:hypothetical protein
LSAELSLRGGSDSYYHQDLPQDRFDQELWNLAAIIEEHLFSEMAQLDEAERRTEEAGSS